MASWEQKVKEAAERIARSAAFRSFFNTEATPEVWEQFISTWTEEALDSALLIVKEEEDMKRDLFLRIERKIKVNETRFFQQMHKLMVDQENNPVSNG